MKKGQNVFVTGATGFIGSKLVQLLLREGFSVRGLYHSTRPDASYGSGALRNFAPRVEFLQGDVADVDCLRKGMAGCQYVFHLAGYAKNWARDFSTYQKINVEGMRNIFQVAREQKVERVVWTSSIVTFGPTFDGQIGDETIERHTDKYFTEYERTKVLAEKEALQWAASGFPVVIVNPTRVFGPGPFNDGNAIASLINDYITGRLFVLYNFGMNIGNYAFVEDVARGHYLAMQHGRIGERYILGGENISLAKLIQHIQEISGKKRDIIPLFKPGALFYSSLMVLWAKMFGGHPRISPEWVRTFSADWAYHCQKAERELGYHPMPLKEAVEVTYHWLLEQNKLPQTVASSASAKRKFLAGLSELFDLSRVKKRKM